MSTPKQQKAKFLIMFLSVGTAFVLMVVKFVAALLTNSMGILASAADSLMDFLMSSINLFAIKQSDKPADKGHPYGHGKIEHIASLFQCFVLMFSVIYIIKESVARFTAGATVSHFSMGYGVMFFSISITVVLAMGLQWVSKRTNSLILHTERLHYMSDIFSGLGVIVALYLVQKTGMVYWDLLLSIGIAIYLGWNIYQIIHRAINELMDHEPPEELQESIKEFILNHHPKIVDIHDFRARTVGDRIFSDFHITIRGETDFKKAHNLTEDLVAALELKFSGLEAHIHYDPEGVDEPHKPELED
jgi:ferrous-iron efflux pump FieF